MPGIYSLDERLSVATNRIRSMTSQLILILDVADAVLERSAASPEAECMLASRISAMAFEALGWPTSGRMSQLREGKP